MKKKTKKDLEAEIVQMNLDKMLQKESTKRVKVKDEKEHQSLHTANGRKIYALEEAIRELECEKRQLQGGMDDRDAIIAEMKTLNKLRREQAESMINVFMGSMPPTMDQWGNKI